MAGLKPEFAARDVPSVSDEDAKKNFPQGWTAPKPYLRIVAQPGERRPSYASRACMRCSSRSRSAFRSHTRSAVCRAAWPRR